MTPPTPRLSSPLPSATGAVQYHPSRPRSHHLPPLTERARHGSSDVPRLNRMGDPADRPFMRALSIRQPDAAPGS